MKIRICDVHKHEKNEIVESAYRIGRKDRFKSIRIDVCDDHKDFFNDCKNMEETEKKVKKLTSIPTPY